MRAKLLLGIGVVGLLLAAGGYFLFAGEGLRPPIVVGLLHSQSGSLDASEKVLLEAEMLAIEELNAHGGVLNRPVKAIVADGRSNPGTFADQARRLITQDKVSVIFGCAWSPCRKSVKTVVEENDHLLFYPVTFEGLEQSPNIVYTAGPANQQVTPAMSWCREVLKAKSFFLVGTDSVGSRGLNALALVDINALGAKVAGDEYVLPGATDLGRVVEKIQEADPDVVICSLEGDSNRPFFERLQQAGVKSEDLPVMSFTVGEEELRTLPPRAMTGHYAAWNYMQSIDRPENQEFIRRFQTRYGKDRVVNDGIVCAYNSVRLWAQAVNAARTTEAAAVRKAVGRQSLDAPEGIVSIDSRILQNWRPFYLGKIRADGQFDIVFTLTKSIPPVPFPKTRPKAEWESFLADLNGRWGGQWFNPGGTGKVATQ